MSSQPSSSTQRNSSSYNSQPGSFPPSQPPPVGVHHPGMPSSGPMPSNQPQPGNYAPQSILQNSLGNVYMQQFPPGSVESTSLAQTRRRKKILTKDLIWVTPKRLVMALRSGLEMETIWAINALNVMLYDDTQPNYVNLQAMPELLDLVLEHLRAVLAHLFPNTFKVSIFC